MSTLFLILSYGALALLGIAFVVSCFVGIWLVVYSADQFKRIQSITVSGDNDQP